MGCKKCASEDGIDTDTFVTTECHSKKSIEAVSYGGRGKRRPDEGLTYGRLQVLGAIRTYVLIKARDKIINVTR